MAKRHSLMLKGICHIPGHIAKQLFVSVRHDGPDANRICEVTDSRFRFGGGATGHGRADTDVLLLQGSLSFAMLLSEIIDTLVLRAGSLGAGSVGFEGQNQFSQLCSSIFRHRVSSCCSISLFMYFNSNFSTGGTAHGSLESICLDPGVGQKRQAH